MFHIVVRAGANERIAVGQARQPGKMLADQRARHAGRYRMRPIEEAVDSGALFRNRMKHDEKSPDFKGHLLL